MIYFVMDTSGPVAGVALVQDGQVLYEAMAVNHFTHSASIMPMTDEAFTHTGLAVKDVDVFGAVTGPGSFTGVRIGVSTIKAMAHAAGKPCAAVNALEAMAASIPYFDGIICPIQDARAGQVYGAAFTAGEVPMRLLCDKATKVEDYVSQLLPLGNRFLFLGDGMPVQKDKLINLLGEKAVFAPAASSYLRPASAAILATHQPIVDYLTLMPYYLRAPQAERVKERKAREAEKACRG